MKLTDEQQKAMEAAWEAEAKAANLSDKDLTYYPCAFAYEHGYKKGYATIHRQIEELRQFIAEIGYVEFGDDLIARRNDADGSFVLFEEDNPVYSVTGSDAFDVWRKWKQEDV